MKNKIVGSVFTMAIAALFVPNVFASEVSKGGQLRNCINKGVETECTLTSDITIAGSEDIKIVRDITLNLIGKRYNISIEDSQYGKIEIKDSTAISGQKVSIVVTPDEGYELDTLIVKDTNGNVIEVKDNTFNMPESDVIIIAAFREKNVV